MASELPEICKTIVLNAPIEKVWKAVSTAEGIAGWWMNSHFNPFWVMNLFYMQAHMEIRLVKSPS